MDRTEETLPHKAQARCSRAFWYVKIEAKAPTLIYVNGGGKIKKSRLAVRVFCLLFIVVCFSFRNAKIALSPLTAKCFGDYFSL